jgi:hypothetical protein
MAADATKDCMATTGAVVRSSAVEVLVKFPARVRPALRVTMPSAVLNQRGASGKGSHRHDRHQDPHPE